MRMRRHDGGVPSAPIVLLALDKFKGCLSAIDVCSELRTGLLNGQQPIEVIVHPVADGGDGTLEAALVSGFESHTVAAAGPLGEPRQARIGIRGSTALIELAEVCGLALLAHGTKQPMQATTYGVGLAMKAAIEYGCRDLVGVGGSASTDGGMGAAVALGAAVLDEQGHSVRPGGMGLGDVRTVDFGPILRLLAGVDLSVATDVSSPLTGEQGAARVFGAQKGASTDEVLVLENGMEHWARQLQAATGLDVRRMPGAGAAGGFAAPFLATRCGHIVSGAHLVLELTGARAAIASADVVVTGEGRWDSQTGTGKAPQAVREAAQAAGRPVIAVAGGFSADADLTQLSATYSLTEVAGPDRDSLRDARILLREVGARIAAQLHRG